MVDTTQIFSELGLNKLDAGELEVHSPIDGARIGAIDMDTSASIEKKIGASHEAFCMWRDIPAPKRGELVRLLGNELRRFKEPLGQLVTIECGKILSEGLGEVQEMIDICDLAVGQSRQLFGKTMHSERKHHTMQESFRPLGAVGIISAFNFPVAVWAWNAAIALIAGNSIIWKPSEKTPLTAMACQHIFDKALKEYNTQTGLNIPATLSQVMIGKVKEGEQLVNDPRIKLVSATGSTEMGRKVGVAVQQRFGKVLLELGGNNAIVVSQQADQDLALEGIAFGACGTTGQRCTSTRRVFIHSSIYEDFTARLTHAYKQISQHIGDPLRAGTLMGPLIDKASFEQMQASLEQANKEGGTILCGGERVLHDQYPEAYYVSPALVAMSAQTKVVEQETFAPILYVMRYDNLREAIELNNGVEQGLSSAIFSQDIKEIETFRQYSDCGIANANIGTSGAEIGGAFGGNKATGWGREAGSDVWKQYMLQQTSTVFYGEEKPELAQGVNFSL